MAKVDLAPSTASQASESKLNVERPGLLPGSWRIPVAILVLLLILPALSSQLTGDSYILNLATRVMTFAIAALSLDLLVGYGGLVSFGHAAFLGIGAYAVGIPAAHGLTDMMISLPVALAAAALFAVLTGAVCLRTKGVYFIMITLAFGQMSFFFASSLAPYGGDDGLTIRARNTLAGFDLFASERSFYFLVLLGLVAIYIFCRALVASRFGRVFRGTRQNAARISAMGFNVTFYQLIAYVISGTIAGFAGFLLANATEFVSPAYMAWQRSGDLIIMVILGGVGRFNGAIFGAAALLLLEEFLSSITENGRAILGPILVLIALFAYGGGLAGIATRCTRFAKAAGRRLAGG